MTYYTNPIETTYFQELSRVEVQVCYDDSEYDLYNGYTEDNWADYVLYLNSLDEQFQNYLLSYYRSALSNPDQHLLLRAILLNLDKQLEFIIHELTTKLDVADVNYTEEEIKAMPYNDHYISEQRQYDSLFFYYEITDAQYNAINNLRTKISTLINTIPDLHINALPNSNIIDPNKFDLEPTLINTPKQLRGQVISKLDIRQSACLFYLLRKHNLIINYDAKPLSHLVWLLTGHSTQNVREDLSLSSFEKIMSGEKRDLSKSKDNEDFNKEELLKALGAIIQEITNY